MADLRLFGATSNIERFTLKNSTTGQGITGLSSASSGLIISTIVDNAATATTYTVAGSTIESITTLGTYAAPTATKCRFKEVDATNHPGLYEFQFADARYAVSSSRKLVISVSGAANLLGADYEIALIQANLYDAVRLGLTALPNAAAEASGGLPTLSAAQASNGTINANVHRWLTGTPNALQSGRVDSYLGAVASGVVAAASFAAGALDAVWSTATRLLTAGTNIVLAKGTGVTGFNDITAADVWAAGTRSLTTFGSLVADTATAVWASVIRSLTDKGDFTLTSAYDPAKTAAQAGDAMTLTAGERTSIGTAVWASASRTLSSFGTLVADVATAVWGAATRTLSAFGFSVTVGTNNDKTGYSLATAPPTAAEILSQALSAESYAADGAVPTLSQALYMLLSEVGEFSISGTTLTCKKLDGTTTSMTFTLNSATAPTSRTRAT